MFGENGLIAKAREAGEKYSQSAQNELDMLNETEKFLGQYYIGSTEGQLPNGQSVMEYIDSKLEPLQSRITELEGLVAEYDTNSLGRTGYQKLPSGLIIQWGEVRWVEGTVWTANTPLSQSISFPTVFPSNCASVVITRATIYPQSGIVTASDYTTTGFTAYGYQTSNNTNTVGARWIAIGY